jgi:hypothetical protein
MRSKPAAAAATAKSISTAATAAARATTAAAAAAARVRLWARFIDDEIASLQGLAIEPFHRGARFVFAGHLDKSESSRLAGHPILDDIDRADLPITLELGLEFFFGDFRRQIPDVNVHRFVLPYEMERYDTL